MICPKCGNQGSDENHISIVWSVDDIMRHAKHIDLQVSIEQARDVLDRLEETHNKNIGINWEIIRCEINDLLRKGG